MSKIELPDSLHGFCTKRGCSSGIMEAKLVQQVAFPGQCLLYGILLDLKKAYVAINRDRCLDIMEN